MEDWEYMVCGAFDECAEVLVRAYELREDDDKSLFPLFARLGTLMPQLSSRCRWLVHAFLHAPDDADEARFAGRGYARSWLDELDDPPGDFDVCNMFFQVQRFGAFWSGWDEERQWKRLLLAGVADELADYWEDECATHVFAALGEEYEDMAEYGHVLEELLEDCETPTVLHWCLAMLHSLYGDPQKAARHWESAFKADWSDWDRRDYFEAMSAQGLAGRYEQAMRCAEEVEAEGWEPPAPQCVQLAWTFWRGGQWERARSYLQQLHERLELPSQPNHCWLWVTRRENYLKQSWDDEIIENPRLHPAWGETEEWSCSAETQAGDLVLLWRTRPESNIAHLWLAISDAEENEEWGYVCDVLPLYYFEQPLTTDHLRHEPRLQNWGPLRRQFQGSVFSIDPDIWNVLLGLLSEHNPDFRGWLDALWPAN